MHYQLQAAYRKLGRDADADRELEIYKGLKAKSRERARGTTEAKPIGKETTRLLTRLLSR